MDKDKLKLLVKNLELLVDSLKSEVYSDTNSYIQKTEYDEVVSYFHDYDEVFEDSDLDEQEDYK